MAIAFVTAGALSSTASATTLAPALPASRVTNNILFAHVAVKATGKTFTVGGGWTIGGQLNTGNMSGAWAWRLVDGAEAAPSFSWTGAAAGTAFTAQFSGNKTVSPIGNINSAAANSSTTETMASITTTAANSVIFGVLFASTSQTIPLPTNYTTAGAPSANANGSDRLFYGFVGASGASSDAVSVAITSADWISFGIEIVGPGGAAVGNNERVTTLAKQVLETYSNANPIRVTTVAKQVLYSLTVTINPIRVTSIVKQVLRSTRTDAGPFFGCICTNAADGGATNFNSTTPVPWDSETIDTHDAHTQGSGDARNTSIVVPAALNGRYAIFTACCVFNNSVTGWQNNFIQKNGATVAWQGRTGGNNAAWLMVSTPPMLLTTGDVWRVVPWNNDTSVNLESDNSSFSMFVVA